MREKLKTFADPNRIKIGLAVNRMIIAPTPEALSDIPVEFYTIYYILFFLD